MKRCDDIKALEKRIEHFKKYIEDFDIMEREVRELEKHHTEWIQREGRFWDFRHEDVNLAKDNFLTRRMMPCNKDRG